MLCPSNGFIRVKMLKVSLGVLIFSLMCLGSWLCSAASVFLSRESAGSLLKRQKRFNTGLFEEMKADNLERECFEERCNLEEAREVFENKEQTMKFWITYIDGDQCLSSPCQNGGKCEDGISTYTCWCPIRFSGKNCELEMAKKCSVNNGGCMHFCNADKIYGAVCDCADGYRLALDGRTCEPTVQYPCGRLGKSVEESLKNTRSLHSPIQKIQAYSGRQVNTTIHNSTESGLTQASTAVNSTTQSPVLVNTTFQVLSVATPTLKLKANKGDRIVGGNEATPGEIPWQIALMDKMNKIAFCGGSLLSKEWVITAAHCVQGKEASFFVRAGEHDISRKEGKESDHEIAEYHIHPRYNSQRSLYNHDIALLKLKMTITFSDFSLPICLGSKDFTENLLKNVQTSLVSGWGRLRYGGIESKTLQKLEVPYVDRIECKGSSSEAISRFMFCAGYSMVRKDACQGDSGGPHASHYQNTWFLTGIVSWGEECAKDGKYGVYTRVSRYMNWISNTTGIRTGFMNSDPQILVQASRTIPK